MLCMVGLGRTILLWQLYSYQRVWVGERIYLVTLFGLTHVRRPESIATD